jgi:cytochrome c-type biogenesis protein
MESTPHVSALIALAAGFLSFVSPCVLPLVPSYIVFITGLSFDELEHEDKAMRRLAFRHSLAFVAGFALVFILLGASATALGALVQEHQVALMRIGGAVIIVMGLYIAGLFQLLALQSEHRIHLLKKPEGLLGTMLVGITFALGWTPCIGPILGSILVLASTSGSVTTGIYLLSAYALGLGIPFLIAGIAFPYFVSKMRMVSKKLNVISKVSGILLIAIGLMMVTNTFGRFTGFFNQIVPSADLEHYLPK